MLPGREIFEKNRGQLRVVTKDDQDHGLKIRSREKRGMGSNPIIGTLENAILLGKIVRIHDRIGCE